MSKWYENSYRRNLVDMHISDEDEEYLSKFSAEEYFANLKKAHVDSAMIYFQSHTGLCNFPTKVSKEHRFFQEHPDELKKLVSLCKKEGIKVVGYYSLIFNNQAVYDHPEWEMVNFDGTTWRDHGQRYGLCCPNNEEYRKFLTAQIEELAKVSEDLDGVFYDMPYWEVVCHCPSCQKKFKEMYGIDLPTEQDFHDDAWNKFVRARQAWMAEFAAFVKKETNRIIPHVTVEFNFAAVIGCNWLAGSTEGINEACEFTGGDLYGDLYNHSFTCNYYYHVSKNQPFEYMTCRANKTLREHTITKSEEMLEAEVMLTALFHGASLNIDAINPDGTMDTRVYEKVGNAFEKAMAYEPFMHDGSLYSDVAVYFDSTIQFNTTGPSNKECCINVYKTLLENHIQTSIVGNGNDFSAYKMVIAPSLYGYENPQVEKLIEYVKNGGTLYLSNDTDERLLKTFFDTKIIGKTYGDSPYPHVEKGYQEVEVYVTPTDKKYQQFFGEFNEKYPLPVPYKLPILDKVNGEVKAYICMPYTDPDNNTTFAAIHSNPPARVSEYPAIIETTYGKGKVIYSLASIEADPRFNYKNIFMNIVRDNVKPEFEIEGSKYVESIMFEDKDKYILNLFDLNQAEDLVERSVTVKLPKSFQVVEALTNKPINVQGNKFEVRFKKYISLIISK